MLQTLQLNSKKRKNYEFPKKKSLIRLTPGLKGLCQTHFKSMEHSVRVQRWVSKICDDAPAAFFYSDNSICLLGHGRENWDTGEILQELFDR